MPAHSGNHAPTMPILGGDTIVRLPAALAGRQAADRDRAASISIRNLTVRFGDILAVDDVSLDVPEGQFLSIVGPSGCGKTTILNLLTGLLPLAEGEISLRGGRPFAGNPDVAYMLARDSLLPWRSALGNVLYGMEIRGIGGADREELARQQLERVGLGKFAHAYPKMLSHGMRQRCALARTFCLHSPILLMDEPFGALDAQTKLALEDLLLQLWSSERRTVILITHDLAEAVAVSDRIVVMRPHPGRIIADIAIPLERPRSVRALQKNHQFHELYAEVWSRLEEGMEADRDR
jgi:NitT/TauT family transport system ATP-binding protein